VYTDPIANWKKRPHAIYVCKKEINWQHTLRRKRRMNAINLSDKRSHYTFSGKKGSRRKSRDLLYRHSLIDEVQRERQPR